MGGLALLDWGWLTRQSFISGAGPAFSPGGDQALEDRPDATPRPMPGLTQGLMHSLMREALQGREQRDRPEAFTAIHRFLFKQHDSVAAVQGIADVNPRTERALLQAAYHCRRFDEAGFFHWLWARVPVYRDAARYNSLESLFVELVDQFAATRADTDPHPLGLRFNPAQQVDNQGRYAEAEAEFRTILDIRRQLDSIGEDHPHMLRTRYWLARMLDAQDRCAEADALLGGLEGELLARCDEGHHYVRELLEYLAGR